MAKKDESEIHKPGGAPTYPPDPPPTASATVHAEAAASAVSAEAAAPPAAAEAAAPPTNPTAAAATGRDFDITLKSNDNPDQTQTVVAHGPDGGLAAQQAMREHPGWTADHSQTHDHIQDTTHGER